MPIIDGNQVTIYDVEHKKLAEKLGWKVDYDKRKMHYRFIKGNRWVWPIGGTGCGGDPHVSQIWTGWQSADLIGGYYTNHKPFDNLEEALQRPLTKK